MNLLRQRRTESRKNRGSTVLLSSCILLTIIVFVSSCGQSQIHQGGAEVLLPAASQGSPTLGIVVDEKMVVLEVEANSAAEKGGIQVGDIIEAVNDIPLVGDLTQEVKRQNAEQVKMATGDPKDGNIVRVQLQRAGQVLILEIAPGPIAPRLSAATVTPVAPNMDYY